MQARLGITHGRAVPGDGWSAETERAANGTHGCGRLGLQPGHRNGSKALPTRDKLTPRVVLEGRDRAGHQGPDRGLRTDASFGSSLGYSQILIGAAVANPSRHRREVHSDPFSPHS
jgi:hypothetical protein